MNFEKRMNKPIVIVLIALMILCSIVPLMADKAFAFSGKIGSEYYTTDGGRITYAPGDGGYSNSRKADLNDTIGNRYAYCVQPSKISPVVGKMTVDKVVTDEDDTGKWNSLRNIVFYSPSYPGYENNVKNIKSEPFYNGNFTHDWAVAHLALSYVYENRPSDLNTFNGTLASGLGEIWTSAKAMGDFLWKSDSSADDAVPDNFKVFISFQENAQDVIVGYYQAPGTLSMKKSSNLTSISDGNRMYDFYGAEYTVYNSDGEAVGTLTTDSYGNSNELEVAEGTYTVKETRAPRGYAKDPETYTVTVKSEGEASFSPKETPITAMIDILLQKRGEGYDHDHGEGDASLEGAVYKFEYYDRRSEPELQLRAEAASDSPKNIWYFETDEKGEINGSEPRIASGYENSELYRDAAGNVVFPLGTYVITEAKASEGYLVDSKEIVVTVSEDGTDEPYTMAYNTGLSLEVIMRGGVKVVKTDNTTGLNAAQGDATLARAELSIVNESDHSVMVDGTEYGEGETVLVITTDENGFAESGAVLPYGRYSIRETKAPEGYLLNEDWEQTFEIREDGQIVDFTADPVREIVIRSGVQVVKRDKELETSEAQAGAVLEGIVMTIRNVSDHDVTVRSYIGSDEIIDWDEVTPESDLFEEGAIKTVQPGEDVGSITVHWNEDLKAYTAETFVDDLPYGTYTLRESKTTDSYQSTDKTEHRFEVREDGKLYSDEDLGDILTFDNYVYRSDVQGTKIADSTSERFSYVPFKIISLTNGETHVVVTDRNGFFSTKDRRSMDELGEDETADSERMINPFDDLLDASEITNSMIEERKSEIRMGVWFGTGEFGTLAEPDHTAGALPYDTYILEEMPCERNEGYTIQKFVFAVDDKTRSGLIDLGTITDDCPEIETTASVNGKNADVKANAEITLVDVVKYTDLKRGETYTVKGKLIDKATGEVVKDAKGNEVTAETTFTAGKTQGKIKVKFIFDGSNMSGMDTVVFESVYDAEGRIVANHADINSESQTVTWEELSANEPETPGTQNTESPKTGDTKNILLPIVTFAAAITSLTYVITRRKKH